MTFLLRVLVGSFIVLMAAACGDGSSAGSPGASAVPGGPPTELAITAKDIAYSPASLAAPAGSTLEIRFDNQDAGIPHNLGLYADAGFSTKLFESEIKTGPSIEQISIPGLIPGVYQFRCVVHPNMTAELRIGG